MPEFQYKARDTQGIDQIGTMSAASKNAVATLLREKGWIVLGVNPRSDQAGQTKTAERNFWTIAVDRLPPRGIHVELSLQQMSMMIRSGMTLLSSLHAVTQQSPRASLGNIWHSVGRQIQRGKRLSEAMRPHKCFPPFVSRLVEVGEQTGSLEVVLSRAAGTMRERRNSREAFVSATIYPVLVLLLSVFVSFYMVVYLIPRLESYLHSLGKQMPAMTQGLIDASFWLRQNQVMLITTTVLMLAAGAMVYFSREGRFWFDRMILGLPIVGRLVQLSETGTFSRSLSMMLKSGITLTEGLGAVENILGNHYLRSTIQETREKVIRGSNLVDALDQKQAFTPMLRQMVAVGEQSGELGEVLSEVAIMHDSQFKSLVKRINALLTPALTIVVGGVVGYVYIAFFMALVAAGS